MIHNPEFAMNFFRWAEIEKDGIIEMNFIGSETRPTSFHLTSEEAIDEADDPCENVLVCVGANPRASDKGTGHNGTAKDIDIQVWKNLYLDIEPIHKPGTICTDQELDNTAPLRQWFQDYFMERDIVHEFSYSGNGFHIWIAFPKVVGQAQIQEFRRKLQTWYTQLLAENTQLRIKDNVRIDHTFSPSRQVKLYGTKKPQEGSRIAAFPEAERYESQAFRDFIFSLPESQVVGRTPRAGSLRGNSGTLEEIEVKYGFQR